MATNQYGCPECSTALSYQTTSHCPECGYVPNHGAD
jgi:DNA-directed RNA polymerase subunit RPC12/RpoP